ncbi:MAG: hypothetical protein GFH27_549293n333 [Chloroflexi bacterium AL-W]|nr:hypothetical protein [Chloroflexi bacterium AL-N1]NOK67552.1 hypothetical protein [Chloroflexi bacterium AL-N10]NOK75678.1 hypothetical protein [Chloroflexi bacterium AL-N5]NOK82466.1 hypothetical protein [Chloroflexi bacterium AL-W]NOK90311.1 hypothetical protein [Chloroflexi bacterium AL-N15]
MAQRTLITGSTGNIGSIVVKHLQATGHPFVAGVKGSARGDEAIPTVQVDFGDPDLMLRAMDGIDTLFLLLPMTDDVERHAEIALEVAKQSGVRHIVRSSAAGADSASSFPLLQMHGQIDDAVRATGIDYTLTLPSSFMQNFINFYGQAIASGSIYSGAGEGKTGWVDVRDLGAVNATILQHPERWRNQSLTVTGPRDFTKETAAQIIGDALGKEIQVIPITDDDAAQVFRQMGMSDFMVGMLSSTDRMTRAGVLEGTTTVVRDVTGNAPITFEAFVQDYKDAWNPANYQNQSWG